MRVGVVGLELGNAIVSGSLEPLLALHNIEALIYFQGVSMSVGLSTLPSIFEALFAIFPPVLLHVLKHGRGRALRIVAVDVNLAGPDAYF